LEGGEWEWGEEDSCATAHSEEGRASEVWGGVTLFWGTRSSGRGAA
jgi:hypothetical protein